MLTGIQVYDEINRLVLTLPVAADDRHPYFIKNIDGLDPVKAEIVSTDLTNQDGMLFQSSSAGSRNIVLRIGYGLAHRVSSTISALRREMYEVFPPKGAVRMRFLSDDFPTVQIVGIVEDLSTVIFSADPEIQISVLCLDPYFTGLTPSVVEGQTNEWTALEGVGSAPSGFVLEITLPRPISSMRLSNRLSYLSLLANFDTGETIRASTLKNNKYVTHSRYGSTSSALDSFAGGTLAMFLDSRTRDVMLTITGETIPFKITFTPAYLGL